MGATHHIHGHSYDVEVACGPHRTVAPNDVFLPSLLRVIPGDTIYLDLDNQSSEPTNEHYHGLDVLPRTSG